MHVASSPIEPHPLPPSLARSRFLASDSLKFLTEEFRRYRVRSEVARKEIEARLRRGERREVEVKLSASESLSPGSKTSNGYKSPGSKVELDKLKTELAEQEMQWKEAYDSLLKENEMLKSKGAEAKLASQWRQRYEQAVRESEQLTARLQMAEASNAAASSKAGGAHLDTSSNYAQKYQQLRDEYSLYRREAKKILESYKQSGANGSNGATSGAGGSDRFAYLKNILLQYLATPDALVRERMEPGIFMALELRNDEIVELQSKKKREEEKMTTWFT